MKSLRVNYARLDYIRRHLRSVWPYLSPRKVANTLLNELEMTRRVTRPRSLPIFLKLEPTPLCQLKCLGCRHNEDQYNESQTRDMMLTLENARAIVEPLKDTLLGVSLSHLGEPFMARELIPIIKYLHESRISVSFPTNFSFAFSDEKIEAIARSGVDHLMISLDGGSAETYSIYRRGGNFDQVLDNVARLASTRRRLGQSHPTITWKYVIFGHNRHEVPLVRQTYEERGFDRYEMVQDSTSDATARARADYYADLRINKKPCYWLWNTMVIRWDGTVNPCCSTQVIDLGNAVTENSADIWRGRKYQSLRRGFGRRGFGETMLPRCRHCIGLDQPGSSA